MTMDSPNGVVALNEGLKIQIASDLHLEFYGDELPPFKQLLKPSAPVLALLGDMSLLGDVQCAARYETWLLECCSHFERVLVLAGNHEYYCEKNGRLAVDQLQPQLKNMCSRVSAGAYGSSDRVIFLENDAVTLNGVRVVGSTLWSKIHPLQTVDGAVAAGTNPKETVEYGLSDFRMIYENLEGGRCDLVRCSEVTRWNDVAVSFIEGEAQHCSSIEQPMLVLSHHAPSFQISSPAHAASSNPSGFGCGFSTDLERLLTQEGPFRSIHTWAFGHTHFNVDMAINKVRVVSNQRGYKDHLASNYQTDCVLHVPASWPPAPATCATGVSRKDVKCDAAASACAIE